MVARLSKCPGSSPRMHIKTFPKITENVLDFRNSPPPIADHFNAKSKPSFPLLPVFLVMDCAHYECSQYILPKWISHTRSFAKTVKYTEILYK